jgi:hypothetical protein
MGWVLGMPVDSHKLGLRSVSTQTLGADGLSFTEPQTHLPHGEGCKDEIICTTYLRVPGMWHTYRMHTLPICILDLV